MSRDPPTPAGGGSGRPRGSPLRRCPRTDAGSPQTAGERRRGRACPVPESGADVSRSSNAGRWRIRATARVAPTKIPQTDAGSPQTAGERRRGRACPVPESAPMSRDPPTPAGGGSGRPQGSPLRRSPRPTRGVPRPPGSAVGDGLAPSRSRRRCLAIRPTPAGGGSGRPQGSPLRRCPRPTRGVPRPPGSAVGDGLAPSRSRRRRLAILQRRPVANPGDRKGRPYEDPPDRSGESSDRRGAP